MADNVNCHTSDYGGKGGKMRRLRTGMRGTTQIDPVEETESTSSRSGTTRTELLPVIDRVAPFSFRSAACKVPYPGGQVYEIRG